MRIAIDYTAALHQGAGIGRYTRELVRALARLDHENEYVVCWARDAGDDPPATEDVPEYTALRRWPLTERTLIWVWHRLRIPLWAELLTGSVDLFHSPDFTLPPLRRAKGVLTIHDLSFLRVPECADPAQRRYLSATVPRSARRADALLADSENTRRDIVELLGLPPHKITVVYPGVDPRFQPARDDGEGERVMNRYGLSGPFILALGTLEPRKNLTRLLKAYAGLRAEAQAGEVIPPLAFSGAVGWLVDEVFHLVDDLGLHDDVLFLGYAPDEDLPVLLRRASCLVYPSLYEGFGLPVLEALACGTPVVTSHVSSLPEVAGDVAVYCDPHSAADIARAMRQVLASAELRQSLAQQGPPQAGQFTWDEAARRVLAVYRAVLE